MGAVVASNWGKRGKDGYPLRACSIHRKVKKCISKRLYHKKANYDYMLNE